LIQHTEAAALLDAAVTNARLHHVDDRQGLLESVVLECLRASRVAYVILKAAAPLFSIEERHRIVGIYNMFNTIFTPSDGIVFDRSMWSSAVLAGVAPDGQAEAIDLAQAVVALRKAMNFSASSETVRFSLLSRKFGPPDDLPSVLVLLHAQPLDAADSPQIKHRNVERILAVIQALVRNVGASFSSDALLPVEDSGTGT
jgi:hypothetical protein